LAIDKFRLPRFDLGAYASLLGALRNAGYRFRGISKMRDNVSGQTVYLRHDIDLHLSLILDMAQVEKANNILATYYVPLTLHFNPLYPPNRQVLLQVLSLGHEIGLHYDLETYPAEPASARDHLKWEVELLSKIIDAPVRTIAMHQPYTRRPDPFRTLTDYVHPHDPRYQTNLLYVSDSCRAWRDESLLTCFGPNPPQRLLLATHPELWLEGNITDRMVYLDQILIETGLLQHRDYFDKTVRQAWLNYPGARQHDEREQQHLSNKNG
jgi:hypothetical protein